MNDIPKLSRRIFVSRVAFLALGPFYKNALADDDPIHLLLHPHGPMAIQSGSRGTRAALGPNDLESFILFGSENPKSAILTSSSPDLPELKGRWKTGGFCDENGTAFPLLPTNTDTLESEASYSGFIEEIRPIELVLAWHSGGGVLGTILLANGSRMPLVGSNFEEGRLFLVSEGLRFSASLWKTIEGGKVIWSGYGGYEGRGDIRVKFSR